MARSKEQWKAQKRLQMQPPQAASNLFQVGRPGAPPPGVRPSAPPTSTPLLRLGTPTALVPVEIKPDPMQMAPRVNVNTSSVIDLTEDDDEEENEPMGVTPMVATSVETEVQEMQSVEAGIVKATVEPQQVDQEQDSSPLQLAEEPIGSAANNAEAGATGQQRMVEEQGAAVATELQQPADVPTSRAENNVEVVAATEALVVNEEENATSELTQASQHEEEAKPMVVFAEDVESDVDEEWPSVPPSVEEVQDRQKTTGEVEATLQSICETVYKNDKSNEADLNKSGKQGGRISLSDSDEDMEADVDEKLPNQSQLNAKSSFSSREDDSTYRIVQLEHLEDGEIYEDGQKSAPSAQMQDLDAQPVGAPHYQTARHMRGGKKQKKRGKKKTKRKLEAMQMTNASPDDVLPEYEQRYVQPQFERVTRPRMFNTAPPPRPYTFAMMKNVPSAEPVSARLTFPSNGSVHFPPGNQLDGDPRRLMQPLPVSRPPPPPYADSQILRVNRQGGMQMFNGDGSLPFQRAYSEPPMYGGFKYRSVPSSPTKIVPGNLDLPLLPPVAVEQTHSPSFSCGRHTELSKPATKEKNDILEDFDLESLRAAALRTKRPSKAQPHGVDASSSVINDKRRHSEPSSPEIDELREQILRSMQHKKKKQAANKTSKVVASPAPPELAPNMKSAVQVATASTITFSMAHTPQKASQTPETTALTEVSQVVEPANKVTPSVTSGRGSRADPTPSDPAQLEETTPEVRPLTACSQSLVIRFSLDDFSPRKSGDDMRGSSSSGSARAVQPYSDKIEELRRQIAEREKQKRAGQLLNQSSSSSVSSLSSSPQQGDNTGKPTVNSASTPEEFASSCRAADSSQTQEVVNEKIIKKPADGNVMDANGTTEISGMKQPPPTIVLSEQNGAMNKPEADSSSEAKPKQQVVNDDRPGDTSTPPTVGDASMDTTADVEICDKVAASVVRDGDGKLNFDAIRTELTKCVAECEEADANIARLSSEMEELAKLVDAS